MATNPISIRVSDELMERLERQAKARGLAPRTLAQQYIEEGLRMQDHPLIFFQSGPSGRRAKIFNHLDVWEMIDAIRSNNGDIEATAEYYGIEARFVQAAVNYYASFRDEIDDWIKENDRMREEGYAAYLAAQRARESLAG